MKALIHDRNQRDGHNPRTSEGNSFQLFVDGQYIGHLQVSVDQTNPENSSIILVGLLHRIELRGDA